MLQPRCLVSLTLLCLFPTVEYGHRNTSWGHYGDWAYLRSDRHYLSVSCTGTYLALLRAFSAHAWRRQRSSAAAFLPLWWQPCHIAKPGFPACCCSACPCQVRALQHSLLIAAYSNHDMHDLEHLTQLSCGFKHNPVFHMMRVVPRCRLAGGCGAAAACNVRIHAACGAGSSAGAADGSGLQGQHPGLLDCRARSGLLDACLLHCT